jgi:acyl carrier protein
MTTFEQVRQILGNVLQLGERAARLSPETALLGGIPEFDSMAVVGVVTALEDQLDILVEDDDITADTFETVGSLAAFVDSKRRDPG